MLLNRVTGGDWPGTLGVRRSVLVATGGYDGRALFENLELVRTIVAAGGREALLDDVFVPRRPRRSRATSGRNACARRTTSSPGPGASLVSSRCCRPPPCSPSRAAGARSRPASSPPRWPRPGSRRGPTCRSNTAPPPRRRNCRRPDTSGRDRA